MLTSGFFSSGTLPAWPSIAPIFAKLGICNVAFALDVSGRLNFCCRPQIAAPTSVAVDPPSIAARVSDAAASLFYSASARPLSRGNNIKSLSRAPLSQGALLSCSLNSRPRVGCSRIIFIAKLLKTTKGPQPHADFVAYFLSPSFFSFALLILGRPPPFPSQGDRRNPAIRRSGARSVIRRLGIFSLANRRNPNCPQILLPRRI